MATMLTEAATSGRVHTPPVIRRDVDGDGKETVAGGFAGDFALLPPGDYEVILRPVGGKAIVTLPLGGLSPKPGRNVGVWIGSHITDDNDRDKVVVAYAKE